MSAKDVSKQGAKMAAMLPPDTTGSIISGITTGALMSPWDKALYLAMSHHRPIFNKANWLHPFQGTGQLIFQRSFQGGIYYFFQGELNDYLIPHLKTHFALSAVSSDALVGSIAGCMNGAVTHPLTVLRYTRWGNGSHAGFLGTAKVLRYEYGYSVFARSIGLTVTRDILFGGIYEVIRGYLGRDSKNAYVHFISNAGAAGVATLFTAPFNFVRNKKLSTQLGLEPDTTRKILMQLRSDALKQSSSKVQQFRYIQDRFKLGPSMLRVAFCMGLGQCTFDYVKRGIQSSRALEEAHEHKANLR